MKIIFLSQDGFMQYEVHLLACHTDKVWIGKGDGEGGEFDAGKLGQVIYEAIDKFYKENF